MANKLFSTKVRAESHQKLEEAIKAGNTLAECREGPKAGDYSVWDGPDDPVPVAPAPAPEMKVLSSSDVTVVLTDEDMDKLATLVAEKLANLKG